MEIKFESPMILLPKQKVREISKGEESVQKEEREKRVDAQSLRKRIEEFLKEFNLSTEIRMEYDKEIDRVIVTVLEGDEKKVIRQIPPQEFVAFLKRFRNVLSLFERSV